MRSFSILLVFLFQGAYCQELSIHKVPRQPYYRYTISTQGSKDSITFYLSEFEMHKPLPLIVYIQGSGSKSLFTKEHSGNVTPVAGHITWTNISKNKAKILIIEKPGVSFTTINENNKLFDEQFSLESWAQRASAVIKFIVNTEQIDTSRIMIAGHSEGGVVAAKISRELKGLVSHVSILAGEGPTQLYSLLKLAEEGDLFYAENKSREERIDSLLTAWDNILANPTSTHRKFWGYSYLRWSSFLSTSVCEELSEYQGKILIVQGDADRQVHPESAKILYASLLAKDKQVRFEIIPDADHSFSIHSSKEMNDGWEMVVRKSISWFLE